MPRYLTKLIDLDNARKAERKYGGVYDSIYHAYVVDNVRRYWREKMGDDQISRASDRQVYAATRYAAGWDPGNIEIPWVESEDDVDLAVLCGDLEVT